MSFNKPNPDDYGFGSPAPHDPFIRRMTNAEAFENMNYLAGNRSGHNFGKLDPKVEAVERGKMLDDIFGPERYRKSNFGQSNEASESKPIDRQAPGDRNQIIDREWRAKFNQADQSEQNVSNVPSGFPSGPPVGMPIPPNPLNQGQQGRMADSFVAEHNAQQQNVPDFDGQSFGQPRNDGPQMGF